MSSIANRWIEDFLIKVVLPGKLIYGKVWGSHSHNTDLPTSNIDFMGVYQVPTTEILGIHPYQDNKNGNSPDFQFYEVGKFCRLLLKGNPGVVEALFTEHWQAMSPAWMELREIRNTFLNQKTLAQYIGYCNGQLMDGSRLHASGDTYNTKWAYHLIRLAWDAQRISEGLPPKIWKEGRERDNLMAIRVGEYTPEQIERMFRDIERSIVWDRIPKHPDVNLLNSWLLKQRMDDLG